MKKASSELQKQALAAVRRNPTKMASMPPEKSREFLLMPWSEMRAGSRRQRVHLTGEVEMPLSLLNSQRIIPASPKMQATAHFQSILGMLKSSGISTPYGSSSLPSSPRSNANLIPY